MADALGLSVWFRYQNCDTVFSVSFSKAKKPQKNEQVIVIYQWRLPIHSPRFAKYGRWSPTLMRDRHLSLALSFIAQLRPYPVIAIGVKLAFVRFTNANPTLISDRKIPFVERTNERTNEQIFSTGSYPWFDSLRVYPHINFKIEFFQW